MADRKIALPEYATGCTVTIHEHLDETFSIRFGPHTLGRFDVTGQPLLAATKGERAA